MTTPQSWGSVCCALFEGLMTYVLAYDSHARSLCSPTPGSGHDSLAHSCLVRVMTAGVLGFISGEQRFGYVPQAL